MSQHGVDRPPVLDPTAQRLIDVLRSIAVSPPIVDKLAAVPHVYRTQLLLFTKLTFINTFMLRHKARRL